MTKKIEFADVSISALNLNIFRGDFDKEALCIVQKKSFKIKEYDVELAIIGASHYISFIKNKEVVFSEVFACVEITGAEQYKGEELREVKSRALNYTFRSMILDLNKNHRLVDIFKNESTLLYEFGMSKECPDSAITGLILDEGENGTVFLQTIHVYPNEEKAIYTNSWFNI